MDFEQSLPPDETEMSNYPDSESRPWGGSAGCLSVGLFTVLVFVVSCESQNVYVGN